MRINGFTQIKAFYSWTFSNQDKQVKPQHISLYLFLLNQNNRNNWIEWFKCPFDLAMTGSCISSKKTYYKCLNDLQEWGLIKYEKGSNNWKAPLIKLEVLKDTSTVPQSEPQVLQLPEQAGEPLLTLLPTHIYKLITDNYKIVTYNIEGWLKSIDKKDSDYTYIDFLQKNYPTKYEQMLMSLDGVDKDKFLDHFENKCVLEDIELDFRKINARFNLLKGNWKKEPKEEKVVSSIIMK